MSIRLLIVEPSAGFRRHLRATLARDAGVEIVGEAVSGEQAIALCARLKPDVVTLELALPDMSGLRVAAHIMAHTPTRILVVSAALAAEGGQSGKEALAAGAIELLEKPPAPDPAWAERLLGLIRLVARIPVIRHVRAKLNAGALPVRRRAGYRLVAIGASTGGPTAVLEIVRALPASFPLPVLLVVHMGEAMGWGFVEWLAGQARLPVRHALDGEPLPAPGAGQVIVAPPGRHLVVQQGALVLLDTPERHACRPSVDVLFESVARELGPAAIGCLLTGMGRDGASGLLQIKQAGGMTLVQDEASSIVYGMPGEAVRLGAAGQVLPLAAIAAGLLGLSEGHASGGILP